MWKEITLGDTFCPLLTSMIRLKNLNSCKYLMWNFWKISTQAQKIFFKGKNALKWSLYTTMTTFHTFMFSSLISNTRTWWSLYLNFHMIAQSETPFLECFIGHMNYIEQRERDRKGYWNIFEVNDIRYVGIR